MLNLAKLFTELRIYLDGYMWLMICWQNHYIFSKPKVICFISTLSFYKFFIHCPQKHPKASRRLHNL